MWPSSSRTRNGPFVHSRTNSASNQPSLDHDPGEREGQRRVGAWPHRQPAIRLDGKADMARVDHDQLGAASARRGDPRRASQQRGARIMAPQQDAAGLRIIRRADAGAGREGAGKLAMPGADLHRIAVVRRAERVDQAVDPGLRIRQRGTGTGRDAEGDRLGTALGGDAAQRSRRLAERLVPGDPLPARIGIAFWPGTAQRIQKPVLGIDQFRRGAALGA